MICSHESSPCTLGKSARRLARSRTPRSARPQSLQNLSTRAGPVSGLKQFAAAVSEARAEMRFQDSGRSANSSMTLRDDRSPTCVCVRACVRVSDSWWVCGLVGSWVGGGWVVELANEASHRPGHMLRAQEVGTHHEPHELAGELLPRHSRVDPRQHQADRLLPRLGR